MLPTDHPKRASVTQKQHNFPCRLFGSKALQVASAVAAPLAGGLGNPAGDMYYTKSHYPQISMRSGINRDVRQDMQRVNVEQARKLPTDEQTREAQEQTQHRLRRDTLTVWQPKNGFRTSAGRKSSLQAPSALQNNTGAPDEDTRLGRPQ